MSQTFYFSMDSGHELKLSREGNLSIGSQGDDILITDDSVSPRHAALLVTKDRVMIKPENGIVAVNAKPVTNLQKLQPGDMLTLGTVTITLRQYINNNNAPSQATQPTVNTSSGQFKPPVNKSNPFALSESLFEDETPAIRPQSTPVTTIPKSAPPPQNHPVSNTPAKSALSTKGQSAAPTTLTTQSTGISDDDYRQILKTFFEGSHIYEEKSSGQLQRNRNYDNSTNWVSLTINLINGIAAWYANRERRRVKPAEYVDEAINQTVLDLVEVAKNEVGMLSTLREPLVIYGPIFWRASGIPLKHICARKGQDNLVRFSAQKVSVLLLDEDMIGMYVCHLDTIAKKVGYHQTSIYNYKDITSITKQDTVERIEMDDGFKEITVNAFRIIVPGDSLTITLNSPTIRDMFQGDALVQPEHEKALNIIRQLWLSKKR